MKLITTLFCIFWSSFVFSQRSSHVEPDLDELLKNPSVIYIAKSGYGTAFLIMYLDTKNKWHAKLYSNRFIIDRSGGKSESKVEDLSHNDFDRLWLKIKMTDVEFLPNYDKIEYKLDVKSIVNENEIDGIQKNRIFSDHDTCYRIIFKENSIKNDIEYCDFYTSFEYNPNVDELISVDKLIKLVKEEFKTDFH